MPFLEDSGIESEDKSSLMAEDQSQTFSTDITEHMVDLDVTFKGPYSIANEPHTSLSFPTRTSSPTNCSSDPEDSLKPPNTCRILQRKLELKVERAKRNFSQYQETKVCIIK
ncbi:uncharacterized protein ACRADG_007838 [Cochliomyia hominivorax]